MERNNSIDLFRFVCAILVVVIHISPFDFINESVTYIVVQILPRIAVPFFFCVSGYFCIRQLEETGDFKWISNYIIKILKVYIFWSVLYFIKDVYIAVCDGNIDILSMIKGFVVRFLVYGSNYHFWFFIALLLATGITALAYKFRAQKWLAFLSIALYMVGLLGGAYYELGKTIPVLNVFIEWGWFLWFRRIFFMGIPFFVLGYFVKHLEKKESNKGALFKTCLFGSLFIGEILLVNITNIQRNIITTVFLYLFCMYVMILLLKNPLRQYSELAKKTRLIANYTFYIHPLIIWILELFKQWDNTILFILTSLICVVSGFLLTRVNNKFIRIIMG